MMNQKIYDLQDKIESLEQVVSDLLDDDRIEETHEYIEDIEKLNQKLRIEEQKERRVSNQKEFDKF